MSSLVPEGVSVCGRFFPEAEIAAIQAISSATPLLCRREIATRACELLRWFRPDGRLKEMSCRVALLRLQALGLIELPPPRKRNGNRKVYCATPTLLEPEENVSCSVEALSDLRLRVVDTRKDSRLWNEAISRFHYLRYSRLPGAQIRYLAESGAGLLGAIGFSASAWKVAPRDQWIGWLQWQRETRLYLVVNNSRFLILPWVGSRNLASWILARCARRLPYDWQARYGYKPVLLETFVERNRFQGTCYKASNWTYVGDTQGRGKLDRHRLNTLPVKQIYLLPLARNFREVLCG